MYRITETNKDRFRTKQDGYTIDAKRVLISDNMEGTSEPRTE